VCLTCKAPFAIPRQRMHRRSSVSRCPRSFQSASNAVHAPVPCLQSSQSVVARTTQTLVSTTLGRSADRRRGSQLGRRSACSRRFCWRSGTTCSNVKLAEALDDRASLRRFCSFSAYEATPERTAFVRFRRYLIGRVLVDRRPFDQTNQVVQRRSPNILVD
jgi:Transposase domain (DUF772)